MNEAIENCGHVCDSCKASCPSREKGPKSFLEAPNPNSHVKKIIGVVSGKGGVGKSLVTELLACRMQQKGFQSGILDADITGPSIPKAFGMHEKARDTGAGLLPVRSKTGIGVMSINLLLPNETDPVVWRGPVIAGTVKQFWTEVIWEDMDFLFVDMPPGTGDVPLTVFQSLPVDGIMVVTSPQEVVSMIVSKAIRMAKLMNIPLLGVVENMSYVTCPDCGRKIEVFGKSHLDQVAEEHGLSVLGRIPIDAAISRAVDEGRIEDIQADYLEEASARLENLLRA